MYVYITNYKKSSEQVNLEDLKAYQYIIKHYNFPKDCFIFESFKQDYIEHTKKHIRTHQKLNDLLDLFKPSSPTYKPPTNSLDHFLIIPSLSTFGHSAEIYYYYKLISFYKIKLFICKKEEYKYCLADETGKSLGRFNQREQLLKELKTDLDSSIKTFVGRPEKRISADFINAYWEYENYYITEATYCQKSKAAKNTRKKLAKEYEQTQDYAKELEEQDRINNISQKPKRIGKKPDYFPAIEELVENGCSVQVACKQLNIPNMLPIDFNRYKIKTRQSMSHALFEYCKEEITKRPH